MKKSIFLLLTLAFILAGCNKTETVTTEEILPIPMEEDLSYSDPNITADGIPIQEEAPAPSVEEKYIINVYDHTIPNTLIEKYIDFEENNTKDYLNNADIFIELFKLGKLKIFKNFKIGENEIFITGVEKVPEKILNTSVADTLECGQYLDFGGTKMYNECLGIIKDKNGKMTLKYGDIIYTGNDTHEIVTNKYLLQKFGTGDGCGGEIQYTLFDENLNKVNFLHNKMTSCYMGDIESKTFEMGNHFITISNNTYLTYGTFDDENDSNRKYTIHKQILSNTKKIEVDMKKSILSGDEPGFYLDIDGKEEKLSFSQIDQDSQITTYKKGEQYFFHWAGFMLLQADIKSKQDFQIKGLLDKTLLFPGEYEERKKKSVTKIEILSCVNNSDTYDTNWYELKSLQPTKNDENIYQFEYKINEKYGNICSMNTPYKIRFYDEKGKITEADFIINLK